MAGIYNPDFGAHFFFTLLPLLILVTIGLGLYYADDFVNGTGRG